MKKQICRDCKKEERKRKGFLCDKVVYQDRLIYRCVHNQSFLKLDILKYYLDIVTTAMKIGFNLCYVDLFSGPGYCFNHDKGTFRGGSSLIALNAKNPFSKYLFIDKDEITSDALKIICERSYSHLIDNIKIKNFDANRDIAKIVKEIKSETALTTVFLDPNGFDIHYSTVKELSKLKRVDLIINFAILDLKRNEKRYRESNDKANLVFGCADWPENKLEWLPFYKGRLKSLGFSAIEDDTESNVMIKTKTGGNIYSLIYASKNDLGLKFWRDAKHYVSPEIDLFDKRRKEK